MATGALDVVKELVSTEKNYLVELYTIINVLLNPLKTSDILRDPVSEIPEIFGNIDEIARVHKKIWRQISQQVVPKMNANPDLNVICNELGTIFTLMGENLKIYVQYTVNNAALSQTLQKLQKNALFVDFCEKKKKEVGNLDLQSWLIKPIQRICKYPLFFREMMKMVPNNESVKQAFSTIDSVNQYVNKCKGDTENTTKLVEIERSLYGCEEPIAHPSRKYLREGVLIKGESKENHVFLFNDCILITKKMSQAMSKLTKKTFQFKILLNLINTEVIPLAESSLRLFDSDSSSEKLLTARSAIDRDIWVNEINKAKQLLMQSFQTNVLASTQTENKSSPPLSANRKPSSTMSSPRKNIGNNFLVKEMTTEGSLIENKRWTLSKSSEMSIPLSKSADIPVSSSPNPSSQVPSPAKKTFDEEKAEDDRIDFETFKNLVLQDMAELKFELEEERKQRKKLEIENASLEKRLLGLEKRMEIFQLELDARD